ncbi:tRNA (guanine-N(1)-)-methyltransferase [Leifsonia xyli subsp. cynodontis DSM 46306]|uniref:Uncharacterized protein n=1 Tax=Leifsonia xyli subsp. cynodontis DSM 46306 TaxID=1389489 RepID=U3P6H8_LEIXC|nr:hypothetical protein [Leifsonia xyli]AGW41069.1 tRNA (guanine-N(1)-)-methyltransferase [Leifsonia xyli subsp. cynodontis DSM 46306]
MLESEARVGEEQAAADGEQRRHMRPRQREPAVVGVGIGDRGADHASVEPLGAQRECEQGVDLVAEPAFPPVEDLRGDGRGVDLLSAAVHQGEVLERDAPSRRHQEGVERVPIHSGAGLPGEQGPFGGKADAMAEPSRQIGGRKRVQPIHCAFLVVLFLISQKTTRSSEVYSS